MMKAKRIRILIVSGVILLILLALSLIPRVASVESLPFDTMTWEKCPELYRDYQELCGDADRWCTVMPEVNVEVVTVKNLWSSCAYYFLPCYRAITRTVPQNGDGAWTASVRILSECSDESSLLARLCDPQLREFELRMEPGEHTVQSMVVDMIPDSIAYQVSIVHHTVTIGFPRQAQRCTGNIHFLPHRNRRKCNWVR